MQIVPGTLNDLPKIMALIKNCIIDMESHGIYQWNDYYPTLAIFEEDIKKGSLFIMEDQGECLSIITIDEEQSPEYQQLKWRYIEGKALVIHRLAVDPVWQKRGIGRRLMDFAENYALNFGYASIRLDAYTGNPRAFKLYENRGYQKVGQLFFPGRELPFFCYEKEVKA